MDSRNKIFSPADLQNQLARWKDQGDKIVFTNGCFDLIHLGHVDYLEKARELGDRLVIGLNSDDSVTQLKGAGRPIIDEQSRARILAAMEFVDAVVLFGEETPYHMISAVVPDILVKGDDYLAEDIVGSDIVSNKGGQVVTIPLVKGYSTSDIIARIRTK